jgi:hypothetical protein
VLVAVLVVAQAMALAAGPGPEAWAGDQPSPLTAPDGHGDRLVCEITMHTTRHTGGSNPTKYVDVLHAKGRCNTGGAWSPRTLSVRYQVDGGAEAWMVTNVDTYYTATTLYGPANTSQCDGYSDVPMPAETRSLLVNGAAKRVEFESCYAIAGNGYGSGSYPAEPPLPLPSVTSSGVVQVRTTNGDYWSGREANIVELNDPTMPDSYPVQYYEGGSTGAGDSAPVPPMGAPTLSCSRVMVDRETTFANFTSAGTNAPPEGAVDTFSWAWGDGTPNWPKATAGHDYPALDTMPENGWTATVTLSRTRGAEVVTGTCALRVDFNQPDKSEAGSDSTTEDDYDCPSGWGWLNPLSILKILKCLFIPSGSDLDGLSDFYGEAKTKAPFSYAAQALTFVPSMMGSLAAGGEDGKSYDDGTPNCGRGAFIGQGDSANPMIDLPGAGGPVQVPQEGSCGTSTGGAQTVGNDGGDWFGKMRTLMQILYLLALAIFVWSVVTWAIS